MAAMGLVYTYSVHIIPKFAKEGCIATVHMRGWSHTWFNPRTPMLYPDEAGERDLRVVKNTGHEATETGLAYAPVSQAHGHNHIVQCFACCTAA